MAGIFFHAHWSHFSSKNIWGQDPHGTESVEQRNYKLSAFIYTMIPEFNPNIVLLAYGVAFIGVYMAVCAAEQLRGEFLKHRKPTVAQMLPSLLMLGFSVGGVSFWGMHSIGMASMTLKDDNGNVVPIRYNIGVSVPFYLVSLLKYLEC